MSDVSTTGHRARLKEKFTAGQGAGLADYELLELLLTFAIPRKDVKPLAKSLLAQFGSLDALLSAPAEALTRQDGVGESTAVLLKLAHTLALRVGKSKAAAAPTLASRLEVLDYLYTLFAGKTREEMHVLWLDAQLKLITDATLFTGTLGATTAAPREIVKRALELNAAGLIVAHNHPSGAPKPSADDIAFTQALASLCPPLGLVLHDHIIVGQGVHYSFKAAQLL
jgi:DNA repair protein RadC